jgi:signal transduction histidine kinase
MLGRDVELAWSAWTTSLTVSKRSVTLAGVGVVAEAGERLARPRPLVYGFAGFGVLLGALALELKAQHIQRIHDLGLQLDEPYSTAGVVLGGLGGFAFLVAGLLAHARRPDNRVGLLMVLVGVGFFAEDVQLALDGWVHSVGLLLVRAADGFLVHLVLAFPGGRLDTWRLRLIAGLAYAAVFVLTPIRVLFLDTRRRDLPKPNLLMIADSDRIVHGLDRAYNAIGLAVALAVVAVLVHRWVRAGPPARRVLAPVFVTGILGAASTIASPLGRAVPPLAWAPRIAFCLLPLAFLVGIWRVRLGRTAVGTLLAALREPMSAAQLEAALARALGDPSLRIGYWRPATQTFVDGDGRALPPMTGTGDGVTLVEPGGRRVAVLVHDPALREDGHVLAAVTAAAELALENQRLTAEVRAQLAEVRDLAGRLVTAGDAERRRLEHDLHDGAQQQLVTAAVALRTAARRLGGVADPPTAALLSAGVDGLDAAIDALRELARGIHPAILTDAGLVPALQALAERTPEPEVRLRAAGVPRLPPAHEATGYFVAAEALTNTLKHAGAQRACIAVQYEEGVLRIEVTDDGVGGADIRPGGGLLGLRDRVTALGGEFVLRSDPGHGTSVAASIACRP